MPTLDELYTTFGKLTIQSEILQSQIMQVKKAIADAINAQNASSSSDTIQPEE
jgi:hypothetical protein